jgi:spore cortex biosynthesis protein YabQ
MYSFEQSKQLDLFFLSLGIGFLLGIVYDILRAIRLTFSKGKALIFIFDIIYFIIFALATFIFFVAINKGEFRFYMIFGEITGLLFYYFSFGIAAKNFTDKSVYIIHKISKAVGRIISAPFLLVYRLISKTYAKIYAFFKKLKKNTEKNRKKHLPKLRLYVYNLLGIFIKRQNVLKKGGYNNEKKKTRQKS